MPSSGRPLASLYFLMSTPSGLLEDVVQRHQMQPAGTQRKCVTCSAEKAVQRMRRYTT